jgi:hypothetical protein
MSDTDVQSELEGKKVFFVYPTPAVQSQVITELIQQEYEVYVCKDHIQLVRVLKQYPASLLFLNIDDKIPESEWEKWITTLKTTMPNLQFGIFSSNSDEELQEKYIKVLKVTCGFMSLTFDMSKSVGLIINVLENQNVKGRRKYIRASTEGEQTATVNMPFNTEYIIGTIKDISVVGFSCVFAENPNILKNSLYKDIQIRLKTLLLKVEAVMFGSRKNNDEAVYVFLFTQKIDSDVRVKIRKYVQQNLQSKMDILLS